MSKSFEVYGITDTSPELEHLKRIIVGCMNTNIPIPEEVSSKLIKNYNMSLDDCVMSNNGEIKKEILYEEHSGSGVHRYDVEIDKLPDDVKKVRFEIAW